MAAGAAIRGVARVAAVVGGGRVGAGLRTGAAVQAAAARAAVGHRASVDRGLQAGAAGKRVAIRAAVVAGRRVAARLGGMVPKTAMRH